MKNNKGLSLAELSIVLAIIGLLLAAVTEGFNMRKSAEIRSFITDINSFQMAVEGFQSKYSDLPGDMSNATSYWTTSDGNSDGQIALGSGTSSEAYRVWQHLVLSSFLDGGYSGVATQDLTTYIQADIGINIPASKRTKVGYSIRYANTGSDSRNEINLGAFYASNVNTNSALTPSEAFALDKKLDDGVPKTGLVHGVDGSDVASTTCVSGSGSSSTYVIANTGMACIQTFSAVP